MCGDKNSWKWLVLAGAIASGSAFVVGKNMEDPKVNVDTDADTDTDTNMKPIVFDATGAVVQRGKK